MASETIGFAIDDSDRARLDRLVERYGGGNRSAFLRAALDHMESVDRAERLRGLQTYGTQRSAAKGMSVSDVEKVVYEVLRKKR